MQWNIFATTDSFPDATETLEILSTTQENLQEVANNPGMIRTWLAGLVPEALNFVFQIVIAVVIYMIGARIIRLIIKMVRRSMERADADEGVRQFVLPVIKYALYVILIFAIMGIFGIATTSAVAVLGSAGVAIGLALQGSLANFAGGVLILLLKPFRVGDYIIEDAGKNEGTVKEISICYTKLVSVDNKVIVIPNGTLSNSSLTNVSQMDKRRVDIAVGISYEADLRRAKEVLLHTAESDPARLPEEEAVVFVDRLDDSSVNMGIRIWVRTEDYWTAKWRLTESVKYALDENGIVIPYPQLQVQVKQNT